LVMPVMLPRTGPPNKPFDLTALLSRPWQQGSSRIGTRGQSHGRASVCSSTPIR
jgi:hypothetical protein